ncbi:Hypothetical predicted protein [Octopus vulgaris]|uniref:Uncharacterized protein n=2 Tax=Octopus TaxID=6643 RepID=A0AA36F3W6_OCTVU|nr:vacuolar fusion protein CCZ1 homolog [Octopus sinensis]CAI9723484.1 Hypothetical predicted protein [Octopus vulgaris]
MASGISLENFYIFNSNYGSREGEEHKKIMFYFPKKVDIDTKMKQIGLSEAIVQFTKTFTDKPCKSLHTQKHRQIFHEPEESFWMVVTITIPSSEKIKDGQSFIDYQDEEVQDLVYDCVLKQAYRMFKLFNGSFMNILQRSKQSVVALQQRLEYFFARYLLTLKLCQSDILDVFDGIHFLPLNKNTYLRMKCFINQVEAQFPEIKYTAFLYNDQLVWSGLQQDDMRIMYRYLITGLFPSFLEQNLISENISPVKLSGVTASSQVHYGRFITGPPDIKDESNMGKVPHVYLNTEEENEECYLLVYRALSASICMFINVNTPLTFQTCKKIDAFLGQTLTTLASDIAEQYSKKSLSFSEPQYKYVYFNHMNLAQKTTVHGDNKKSTNLNIPPDTIKLLSDISSDFSKCEDDAETIVKTLNDSWVVGKKSDHREFYVVINQKNANLIEINEEVKKLCSTHFNSVFFLD